MARASDFVFLHGGVQGSWVWDDAIAALRRIGGDRVGQCLALDVPGCGAKRGRDTSALSFEDIVRDLLADIDAAGLRTPVLVGHSQAGTVLPRLIAARPGLFRRVIYISCVAPEHGETVVAGTVGDEPEKHPADQAGMFALMKSMFCNDMDETATMAFAANLGQDAWPPAAYVETKWRYDHLAAIPATYVKCARDAAVTREKQELCASRLKVDRIREVDSGHQLMNSQPRLLAEVLLAEAVD
ncbi:MAG TPA: alpha/beta hydrolase [Novosphingobium sp.]